MLDHLWPQYSFDDWCDMTEAELNRRLEYATAHLVATMRAAGAEGEVSG